MTCLTSADKETCFRDEQVLIKKIMKTNVIFFGMTYTDESFAIRPGTEIKKVNI